MAAPQFPNSRPGAAPTSATTRHASAAPVSPASRSATPTTPKVAPIQATRCSATGASVVPLAADLHRHGAQRADHAGVATGRDITAEDIRAATIDSIRALMLIRAYRVRGHLYAKLDPLGLKDLPPTELALERYGLAHVGSSGSGRAR